MSHLFKSFLIFTLIPISLLSQNQSFLGAHGESELCAIHESNAGSERQNSYLNGFTSPYVIGNNDSFSFHIKTGLLGLSYIKITSSSFNGILQNGAPVNNLILFDDGNGSDEIAYDNIFSAGGLTFNDTTKYVTGKFFRFCDFTFTYDDSSQTNENIDLGFGIRRINLNKVAVPTVTSIDDSMQITTHLVNMVRNNWDINPKEITQKYYSKFPDDRDIVMLATTYPTPGGPAAAYESIRLTEAGTHYNTSNYDYSSNYGSNGKLMGLMRFFYTYGGGHTLVIHELLHQWAAFLNPSLNLSTADGHWGVIEVESSGFGGGWQVSYINQVFDSLYLADKDASYSSHYNKLEQYLMGLIPLDSVSFPIKTLANFTFQGFLTGQYSHISTTGILQITKSMFESAMPTRNPDFLNAQKNFKSALIVISDRLLTPLEMAYYDFQMKQNELGYQDPNNISELGVNFQETTFGKAQLETILPQPCIPTVNLGDDISLLITDSITLDVGSGFVSYLWNDNSTNQTLTIKGEALDTLTYTYMVTVTDSNNCSNTDTILITFHNTTGIKNTIKNKFIRIYPNPSKGMLYIEILKNPDKQIEIEIINISGQILYNKKFSDNSEGQIERIDLSSYSKGSYFIKAHTGNQSMFEKIILD